MSLASCVRYLRTMATNGGATVVCASGWNTFADLSNFEADMHCWSDRQLKWSGRQTFRVRARRDDRKADRWRCIRGSVLRLRDKWQPSFLALAERREWFAGVLGRSHSTEIAVCHRHIQSAFIPSPRKLYPHRWSTFGLFAYPRSFTRMTKNQTS